MSDEIKTIVVPVDGSEGAAHASRFAGVLARATNADIHLLAVNDPDAYVISTVGEAAPLTTADYEKIYGEQLKESFADPAFTAATESIGGIAGSIEQQIVWGHPAEAICSYAKDKNADMIIIGSRGRSAFTELLLGSVSSQVLHHAPCPVTIVH